MARGGLEVPFDCQAVFEPEEGYQVVKILAWDGDQEWNGQVFSCGRYTIEISKNDEA